MSRMGERSDASTADATVETTHSEDAALASTHRASTRLRHEPLTRGAAFGRYTLLEKIGAGAMGIVLAAYDPRLDRKVALKLLSTQGPSQVVHAAHARLLAEGKALAKLDHPNVVAVHDIGEHEGRLFIAMDLIEGQTLRAWLSEIEQPRPWAEVVEVFRAAGRGLAAAHAVGLVHRDFKPDNVMLGADGRVRVMDFGLARATETNTDANAGRSAPSRADTVSHETATGALLGTPAYMSPEQTRGAKADARSDQFGFCVALYEALYGARPFAGRTLAQLFDAITSGELREPPSTAEVPQWLHQIVVRGLSGDPAQRFASMQDLLDALARDRARRRQQLVGLTLAAGLGAGLVAMAASSDEARRDACAQIADELAGVWDDARRAEVHAALLGTGSSLAPSTWVRVEAELDAYTTRWIDVRTRACEANQLGTESDTLFDLRMACLNRRLLEVETLVEVFADADAQLVTQAVDAVHALRELEQCVDVEALEAEAPLPADPRVAARVDALRERLIEADKLHDAGKYAAGLAITDATVREAQGLDFPPLLASAWLAQAQLRQELGDYEGAEASLELVYAFALERVMVDEAAEAATQLIYVVGERLARHRDGQRWAKDARPLTLASGSARRHARMLNNLGRVTSSQGEHARARDYCERALAMDQESFGREHPIVAKTFSNLGAIEAALGEHERAREHHAHALSIREQAYGPEHPEVADSLNNLGTVLAQLGEYEQAREHHERALSVRAQALGPEHPEYSASLNNLGNVLNALGDHQRAKQLYHRALTIREQTFGPTHPLVAVSLNNLATIAYNRQDYGEASSYHERALAIREQNFGPEHPAVARSLYNLGESEHRRGAHERARSLYQRALAIMEASLGTEHPSVAFPLTGLGVLALEAQELVECIALLTRALELHRRGEGALTRAEARFALARALWDALSQQGRDRERALSLAERARADYLDAGAHAAESLAEVDAWLAARGPAQHELAAAK